MGPEDVSDPPLAKTPPSHKESTSGAKGKIDHPNYSTWQTRTGNVPWYVNDTKGNEFIIIQHRTGSHIEMRADGVLKFVSAKNREDIVYGKHVTKVTGAQDMTVDGDSSVKTGGTRRITTNGDSEDTVKGRSVISAKSVNVNAAEQIDIAGQSFTSKVKNGILMQSTDGSFVASAVGSSVISSKEGSVGILAETGAVGIAAKQKLSALGEAELHIKGGGGEVVCKGGKVYINCGMFESPKQVYVARADGINQSEPDPRNT